MDYIISFRKQILLSQIHVSVDLKVPFNLTKTTILAHTIVFFSRQWP